MEKRIKFTLSSRLDCCISPQMISKCELQSEKPHTVQFSHKCKLKQSQWARAILLDVFYLLIEKILLLDIQHTQSRRLFFFFLTRALNSSLISHWPGCTTLPYRSNSLLPLAQNFFISVWSSVNRISVRRRRRRRSDLHTAGDFCCNLMSENTLVVYFHDLCKRIKFSPAESHTEEAGGQRDRIQPSVCYRQWEADSRRAIATQEMCKGNGDNVFAAAGRVCGAAPNARWK